MHLVRDACRPSAILSAHSSWWSEAGLDLYLQGLLATDLLCDLQEQGRFTLLAPSNAAFEALRVPLSRLLVDPGLLEARFDTFEHTVVRGCWRRGGRRRVHRTLHGSDIVVGAGLVTGSYGYARIQDTHVHGRILVHVLDSVVLPTPPQDLVVGPRLRMVP